MKNLGLGNDFPGLEIGLSDQEYERLQIIVNKQVHYNGWFTKKNVQQALLALSSWLETEKLESWLANYQSAKQVKRIGIIMAGNIPLVGFHDFLCVLMSGNKAVCKLSSDDQTLLPAFVQVLTEFLPALNERIELSNSKIAQLDAVIATGSNNSTVYFEQYFGKYPHIFRKNRTSVAVISGNESQAELKLLGNDIFNYFGLGCRNVSHLIVPNNYQFDAFFEAIFPYGDIINHNKYCNNYDYHKAVYLMNQIALLDNHFVLLRESDELHPPLAMLHYHFYQNQSEIDAYLNVHNDSIQLVLGKDYAPFGSSQQPSLNDYADDVDTMKWLQTIF